MNDIYTVVIVVSSIALAFITSARIAYTLADRWGFHSEPRFFFTAGSGLAAAVLIGFCSTAAVHILGMTAGLLGVFLTVPLVGFVWLFVVGSNKALERIIGSLLAKVS